MDLIDHWLIYIIYFLIFGFTLSALICCFVAVVEKISEMKDQNHDIEASLQKGEQEIKPIRPWEHHIRRIRPFRPISRPILRPVSPPAFEVGNSQPNDADRRYCMPDPEQVQFFLEVEREQEHCVVMVPTQEEGGTSRCRRIQKPGKSSLNL